MRITTHRRSLAAIVAVTCAAAVLAGCGTSIDPALVTSAGEQGNILETNYALLSKDVLKNASTRDLKDVNAAIDSGDPDKATAGDLRRAEGEIRHRINVIESTRRSLAAANLKLRKADLPDFEKYLSNSDEVDQFSDDYAETSKIIQRTGTETVAVVSVALNALEKYLDFLEQWEEYATDKDTDGLQSSANASDAAVAKLSKRRSSVDENVDRTIKKLVDSMADAASEDSELNQLIDDLRDQYPKSFLPLHLVEE